MKNLIFSIFFLWYSSILLACSCGHYVEQFCYSADTSDNIALVTLTGFDITAGNTSGATFSLIENINGLIPSTISVLSSDGFNCNLYLPQFVIGDTLIINVRNYSTPLENTFNTITYDWGIEDCSRHYLNYSDGIVYGKLDTFTELEELDYEFFKAGLFDCFDFFLANEEILGHDIKIYPNPTDGELFIISYGNELKKVNLYNLNGQHIEKKMIRFSDHNRVIIPNNQNGVFILEIITLKGILRRKVIKLNP